MAQLWALQDRQEGQLQRLGEVCILKEYPHRMLRVKKRVEVPGAGRYVQRVDLPMYSPRTIRRWRATPQGKDAPLIGAATPDGDPRPIGFIQQRQGAHLFCLPLGEMKRYLGLGWRVQGFLACDRGCVAVLRRRVLFWVLLTLGAVAAFGLSFLLFRLGPQEGFSMLWEALQELPEATEVGWYGFWHRVL